MTGSKSTPKPTDASSEGVYTTGTRLCVINPDTAATTGKRVGFVSQDTDGGERASTGRPAVTEGVMRGQTTLDFAIGVSIFIAVVLFTFGFVPSVLDPFDVVAEDNPTLADRTADNLAHGQLGSADQPSVLDWYCTVEYFEGNPSPSECNYEGQTLEQRLNLGIGDEANITITQEGDLSGLLCWTDDAGDGEPGLSTACTSGDSTLAIGEARPGSQETTIASRRVVSLYGETVVLEVVLW